MKGQTHFSLLLTSCITFDFILYPLLNPISSMIQIFALLSILFFIASNGLRIYHSFDNRSHFKRHAGSAENQAWIDPRRMVALLNKNHEISCFAISSFPVYFLWSFNNITLDDYNRELSIYVYSLPSVANANFQATLQRSSIHFLNVTQINNGLYHCTIFRVGHPVITLSSSLVVKETLTFNSFYSRKKILYILLSLILLVLLIGLIIILYFSFF